LYKLEFLSLWVGKKHDMDVNFLKWIILNYRPYETIINLNRNGLNGRDGFAGVGD